VTLSAPATDYQKDLPSYARTSCNSCSTSNVVMHPTTICK